MIACDTLQVNRLKLCEWSQAAIYPPHERIYMTYSMVETQSTNKMTYSHDMLGQTQVRNNRQDKYTHKQHT